MRCMQLHLYVLGSKLACDDLIDPFHFKTTSLRCEVEDLEAIDVEEEEEEDDDDDLPGSGSRSRR